MNTKNINKKALAEIVKRGGAVAVSEWTTGSGRHTSRRATPAMCKEFKRGEKMPRWAAKVMRERPLVKTVIAVESLSEAKRVVADIITDKPTETSFEPKKRVTFFDGIWRIRVGRNNRVRWEGGAWVKTSHFREGVDDALLTHAAPCV